MLYIMMCQGVLKNIFAAALACVSAACLVAAGFWFEGNLSGFETGRQDDSWSLLSVVIIGGAVGSIVAFIPFLLFVVPGVLFVERRLNGALLSYVLVGIISGLLTYLGNRLWLAHDYSDWHLLFGYPFSHFQWRIMHMLYEGILPGIVSATCFAAVSGRVRRLI